MSRQPWIQTYTGKAFELLDPKPEQIDIVDIAHALSNLCRFTGHSKQHYSVAQHSCLVATITERMWWEEHGSPCPPPVLLAALLHDAPEAYVGDVSTPLKIALRGEGTISEYDVIERRIANAIEARFLDGKRLDIDALIKRADLTALATEHCDLFDGPPPRNWGLTLPEPWAGRVTPWSLNLARREFLHAFRVYGGRP
jgi:5'-deoxynucleotidase YfbR-like HD superfamily hydrolase